MDLCRVGILGLFALALLAIAPARGGDDRWQVLRAGELRSMLESYHAAMVKPRPPAYRTREEWLARKRLLRRRILQSLGLWPLPPRVPLDVRFSGQIERDDYTVKRIYFQVWPRVYASGYLYWPKAPGTKPRSLAALGMTGSGPVRTAGRLPAVLCPHGHWAQGARDPVVQSRCISFVKQGYIVLVWELDFDFRLF